MPPFASFAASATLPRMTAKPIFVGGTGSHAGKSWVATALCRYLYRMGHRVAPFKAQNMSNNSMVCADGGEIGRAQVAQAEACGLSPTTDMNPILLKPTGQLGSQVVLNGRPWKNLKAREYYEYFDLFLAHVLAAYARLAAAYDYVVIEGAGSVTELNLKHRDLVNLGLARRLNAPSMLVSDIDRGGVFASVIGTFHLLEPEEATLMRSFLVNRFRGDVGLFADGIRILEEQTHRPCLGVFPYAPDIYLDAEDSVSLEGRPVAGNSGVRAGIVRLPHISNFTDFRLLPDAVYLSEPSRDRFDVIFLPGTKNTIDDMNWLRAKGFEAWIFSQIEQGSRVIGICGGFQMLGQQIIDPDGVESSSASVRGLGLLPVETRLAREKTTRVVTARTPSGIEFQAYEIHMGVTMGTDSRDPFAIVTGGRPDGFRTPKAVGTYLHGALENKAVLEELVGAVLPDAGLTKESQYDRLAEWFGTHVNKEILAKEYL
jgi:adenosylcobyric acid synthase